MDTEIEREPMRCPKCDGTKLTTSKEEEGWVVWCENPECECGWLFGQTKPKLWN